MSNGGYKGNTPARETSPEQYPGVWELTEQFQAQADGNWPFQDTDCAPKSLRFDSASGAYLAKTPSAAGNRRVFTFSCWYKRTKFGSREQLFSAAGSTNTYIEFQDDQLLFEDYNPGINIRVRTNRVFRDPSAFYSIVISVDTTISSPVSDRVKIFINGLRETSMVASNLNYGTLNYQTSVNSTGQHKFGQFPGNTSFPLDGLICDAYLIDGQALSCEEFGFFDGQGIWQPKRFTGDYGQKYPNFSGVTTGGTQYNGPYSNVFDGNPASRVLTYTTTSTKLTLDSPPAWTNKIEIRALRYGGIFEINGVDISGLAWTASPQYLDATSLLGSSGTLQTIEVGDVGSNYVALYSIKLDGVELIQPTHGNNSFKLDFANSSANSALGLDSSGLGNDWTPNNLSASGSNQSQVWSSNVSGGASSYGAKANAFDGSLSTFASPNPSSPMTYTNPAPANAVISTFEIYGRKWSTATAELNDTDISSQISTTIQWHTITGFTGQNFSKLYWAPTSGGYEMRIFAIRLNGSVLVDSTISDPFVADIDSLVDSPVNGNQTDAAGLGGIVQGNYATLNPLNKHTSNNTLSNGNLEFTTSGNDGCLQESTIGMSSGKFYFEVVYSAGDTGQLAGIRKSGTRNYDDSYIYTGTANKYTNGGSGASYGAGLVNGDVIGTAFDADNGTLTFYKNGVSQGQAFSGISGTYSFLVGSFGGPPTGVVNFGQRPYKYQNAGTDRPSADYKSLCTANLPESTIKRGDEAMAVALYTGNQVGQTIDNLRISPDLVWIKNRSLNPSSGHYWHIHDTVRGKTGSFYNALYTNGNESENTYAGSSYGGLSDITDDGFTLSPAAGYSPAHLNKNGTTYAAFCWDAGETTTTIAAGSLNSSAYDQSQTWSNSLSATFRSTEPATNAFDGDTSTIAGSAGSITYTTPVAVASSSTIRVFVHGGDHNVSVNSGANQTVAAGSFVTVNFTNPTNSTFTITFDRVAGGADTGVRAIEIGGKLLVDNGVSVSNVPSVATTVRSRPETGFAIATYTGNSTVGATVAHGFSKKPSFFMVGCRNITNGNYFDVWHSAYYEAGTKNYIRMASGSSNGANYANDMFLEPTDYVNTLGSSGSHNGSANYVMYSWTSVEGYSSFGEFVGVGSESSGNGPFVYCGFKPALILWKLHSADGGNWFIVDTTRHPSNVNDAVLRPNTNGAETDSDYIDVLSNGFKVRATPSYGGALTGGKFLYAAWAENPFASQTRAN